MSSILELKCIYLLQGEGTSTMLGIAQNGFQLTRSPLGGPIIQKVKSTFNPLRPNDAYVRQNIVTRNDG